MTSRPTASQTFKSRRRHQRAFRADNGPNTVRVDGKCIQIPKIGWVNMREELCLVGGIREISIVQDGGPWFACATVRVSDDPAPFDTSSPTLGADVGISTLATVSDGTCYENLKPLAQLERKLARMQGAGVRSEDRHGKNKRSNRRDRKRLSVRNLHTRIKNLHEDAHHKATTTIAAAGGA